MSVISRSKPGETAFMLASTGTAQLYAQYLKFKYPPISNYLLEILDEEAGDHMENVAGSHLFWRLKSLCREMSTLYR